ncbi:MAG TPA: hypothetical protein VFW23_09475 [Tepidisphaeraceae bacterium]|nr:hypothetical protein [Tepidisphaeraceae bacterium]
MTQDQLEFSITQYLDGSLPESQRVALMERLEKDPEARELLEEHRRLNSVLGRAQLPAFQLEAFSKQLSEAIAQAPAPEVEQLSLRMPWLGVRGWMAIAASVLIASGLAIAILSHGRSGTESNPVHHEMTASAGFVTVTGPVAEATSTSDDVQVSVGPSKAIAGESTLSRYSADLVMRPAHVMMVASGVNPDQDMDSQPFDMQ